MTCHKASILLKTLANLSEPMSAAEIAKATGSRLFSANDTGHFLQILESEGKVRKVKKGHRNLWELVA